MEKPICTCCKTKPIRCTGLCSVCYSRFRTHGDPTIVIGHLKGTVGITKAGYRRIMIDGRRIFEHRYVMEKALNRRLGRFEIIHHKNHDRLDNRLENLELTNPSKHGLTHSKYFNSDTHRECYTCRKIKLRSEFLIHSPCLCKNCKMAYERKRLLNSGR